MTKRSRTAQPDPPLETPVVDEAAAPIADAGGDEAAPPVVLARPKGGGSYVRQPDGSLKKKD